MINWLKMYKISEEAMNFVEKTMKTWKVELTSEGEVQWKQRSNGVFFNEKMFNITIHKCDDGT